MKFVDINRKFTEKVAEYIAKGYIINSQSMAGSQGEIGKIDLSKGKELIRIWNDTEYRWDDSIDGFHGDRVVLRVSKWIKECDPSISDTVWMNDLEHIEEYTYYEVDRYGRYRWYLDNIEEAIACAKKQAERRSKYSIYDYKSLDITSDVSKEIAVKYLKNQLGYQRVSRDNIRVLKRVYRDHSTPTYLIEYNSHTYRLM